MIGEDIARAGTHLLAMICGGVGFVCFFASFYSGAAALYALLLWGSALGLEYAVSER